VAIFGLRISQTKGPLSVAGRAVDVHSTARLRVIFARTRPGVCGAGQGFAQQRSRPRGWRHKPPGAERRASRRRGELYNNPFRVLWLL
jgi:hypothetical protein